MAIKYETAAEQAAQDCPIRFQGQYEDAETGLYYNRYRYYDPLVGQYMSPAPLGLEAKTRSSNVINNVSPNDLHRTHEIGGKSSSKRVREMVENMKKNGFGNEPIKVIEHDGSRYIVDGHHRLAAAKRAGVNVNIEIVDPKTVFKPGSYVNMQDVLDSASSVRPDNLRGPGGTRW